MESPLASWQLENFSNAAEFSPPISPSPQSPTLYSNAHQNEADASIYLKPEAHFCSSPSSRAELASRILNNLEHEDQYFYQHDNDMRWTEESVNLELFENLELDDFSFTARPLTPDSQEFKNQLQLQQLNESPQPSPSHEIPSDSFDELSAEFQNILAGLSAQVKNIDNGEIIELLGIPCSLEEIQRLSFVHESNENESGQQNERHSEESNSTTSSEIENSMDIDDESHTFDDFELQLIERTGSQSQDSFGYTSATSPTTSVISDEEIDVTDHTCENILDALLQGDINTAKLFVSLNQVEKPAVPPTTVYSTQSTCLAASSTSNKRKKQTELKSSSGSGSTGMKKPRLPSNTDKTQRKKEQNKTAATRYREKKKLQAAIISVQEDALEKVNGDLKNQRDDLHRQVLIYKELLRAVMLDRKTKKESATRGRHTGSKRLTLTR